MTTLDPDLQERAAESMGRIISPQDYPTFGAAATTIESNTGKIRAMVQSTSYSPTGKPEPGKTQVNWGADFRYGASGGFSVGSTMKLFAVIEALKQGKGESYVIPDIRPPGTPWYPRDFQNGCTTGAGAPWTPGNAEGDDPPPGADIGIATRNSINTAFIALAAPQLARRITRTAGSGLAMGPVDAFLARLDVPDGGAVRADHDVADQPVRCEGIGLLGHGIST